MTVKIAQPHVPAGKLAEAELHFSEGPLAGLTITGIEIWESRSEGSWNVTLPAVLTGGDMAARDRIRRLILEAYRDHRNALR